MKIETLKDRIQNAESKVEKKQNTIIKKEALIEKKTNQVKKMGFEPSSDKRQVAKESGEAFWMLCDIENYQADIIRLQHEIEEVKTSLEGYKKQLSGEIEKESILLIEIPDNLKKMQAELVESWDEWDIKRRNQMQADYKFLGWKEYSVKYRGQDRHFKDMTDEQIHSDNVDAAKCLVLDLYYRVKKFTGEITDWSNVHACQGACGMTVLNGFVIGKEGRAEVESILAGGYNIQRLHVRVLVKEYM